MVLNKKVNTYFICATQTGNLGDLIINKMLVDELCKYGNVYLDVFGIPDEFQQPMLENENVVDVSSFGFTVKRFSFNNLFKFIFFLKRHDVKLITRSPGPLCEPSNKVRVGFTIINKLAQFCRAKVVYFGNCCSEAIAKEDILKTTYMDGIFVRSLQSVEYAKTYLKCPVSYIPDMAFLMASPKACEKKKTVIVDYRSVADDNEKSVSDLKSIVHDFRSLGYAVELYFQVKSDIEDMLSLYEILKDEGVTMRKKILWYEDMESYYSDKAFVVSNRLHSLLFGAAYGVIPVARISDDPHVTKIMHVFKSSLPEMFYQDMMINRHVDVNRLVSEENICRRNLAESMQDSKKKCSEIISGKISELE